MSVWRKLSDHSTWPHEREDVLLCDQFMNITIGYYTIHPSDYSIEWNDQYDHFLDDIKWWATLPSLPQGEP